MQLPEPEIDLKDVLKDKEVQQFFTKYLGKVPDDFEDRVKAFQTKALAVATYRCIKTYSYLLGRISLNPFYSSILPDFSQKTILDLGCCFGTDMRKMISDGANPQLMWGIDLHAEFFPLGHLLFSDEDKLPLTSFLQGDFFQEDFVPKISQAFTTRQQKPFNGFNLVQLGAVLHLLNEDGVIHILSLIKKELLGQGAKLIGQTVGRVDGDASVITQRGDLRYLHTKESLRELMEKLGYLNVQISQVDQHWPLWTTPGQSRTIFHC